ncbi:MAG: hypothetical protein ABSF64_13660 [Bryobacteraceae bacterium]|jgi:hypothetical protein
MRTIVACLFLAATALAANGVTGKWRGTITTDNGQMPAYLALEQSGDKVTGLAGGSEKMVFKITEGSLKGDRLTVAASPAEGTVLRFLLKLDGDSLEGDLEENGNVTGTAKLTREK